MIKELFFWFGVIVASQLIGFVLLLLLDFDSITEESWFDE